MRISSIALAFVAGASLAACGGGGGTSSTPTPRPAPTPSPTPTPTPTPASNDQIAHMVYDETFEATSARSETPLGSGLVTSSTATAGELSIRFDATTRTYVLSGASGEASFSPDSATYRADYDREYTSESGSDVLRLYSQRTQTRFSDPTNRAVAMGLWQHADGSDGIATEAFVFGWRTPQSGVPAGFGHYRVTLLGAMQTPGLEPMQLFASGSFTIDFLGGVFRSSGVGSLQDSSEVGAIDFASTGDLSADGSLGGRIFFRTYATDATIEAALQGGLYGTDGSELGATFVGSSDGTTVVGAMIGSDEGAEAPGYEHHLITLTNPDFVEEMQTSTAVFEVSQTKDGGVYMWYGGVQAHDGTGVAYGPDGVTLVRTPDFDVAVGETEADPDDPTFDRFVTTNVAEARDITASFYVVGEGNDELELTYASFARVEAHTDTTDPSGVPIDVHTSTFHLFGVQTHDTVVRARSGTATYSGVVYGAGADTDHRYTLTGTSRFAFDFDTEAFSGALAILATNELGGTTNYGIWSFDGDIWLDGLSEPYMTNPAFTDHGSQIHPYLFGPMGEELGATFRIGGFYGDIETDFAGVTVARQD